MVFNNQTYVAYKNLNKKSISRIGLIFLAISLILTGVYSSLSTLQKADAASAAIYNTVPDPLPSNSPSLGFQATSTAEFGDRVTFSGTNRNLDTVTVTLSSWACESGAWNSACVTSPGATFSHPITLNIYEAGSGDQHGALIKSVTQNFAIPYRPSADPTCPSPTAWRNSGGDCFNGLNHNVTFDLDGQTVPDSVVYGVAYNTQSYGVSPTGVDGPYNSLNVSLNDASGAPYTGSDPEPNGLFWNTTPAFDGDGTFKMIEDWAPYKISAMFNASAPEPPAAPNLVYPANNSKVNASSPIANDWSDVAGADHYVYQSYNVDSGGNCNLGDVRFTGDYTASQTNSRVIADGLTFCWRVKTVGTNGLESAWSDLWKVTIDNTTPTLPTMVYNERPGGEVIANGGLTDSQMFRFNLSSASDTTRYQLKYWNDIVGSPFKEASPWNPSDLSGYSSSLGVYNDNFTQGPGVHYFAFSACDGAGNCSAYSAPFVVTFDNVPPGVPVNGQPHNTYLDTNVFSFTWDGVSDATTYEFQASMNPSQSGGVLNSGVWNNIANGNSSQNNLTTPMIPSVGAPDGKWYWQVRAIDGAGNKSAWSEIWNVTLDTVDPSVPVHASPADGTVTTTANQTLINWDDSTDASSVSYVYQSSLSSMVNPDGSFVAPAYTSGPLSSSEIPTPGTPAGTYHWHVKAVDAAGNESAWSNPWVIVVDNTAPVVTLDAIPDSDDTTPTLTGTVDDPVAVVTVSINGGTPANATNNGDGTWTYTVDPALTTGDYTVTVAAADSAGNATNPEPTDDFSVTEPVVVVTQTQGGDGAGAGTDGTTGGDGGGVGAPAAFFAGLALGGAGDGGDGGDGAPADQGVQGADDNANDGNGNVNASENAKVAAAATDDSGWQFNWWWLAILAALAAAFYGWYRYRQAQADKTL